MIEFDTEPTNERPIARIKVVGVGGGGGNTVNSMIVAQLKDVEFIAANTDAQALALSRAHHKIQLGMKSTKGLGTGADPELGKRAAEEDLNKVMDLLEDADIVVLTAGMGGGTGSGALPVIANKLKEKSILTIAVLTKPFSFEGRKRAQVAQEAIVQLRNYVDTLLVIPNQRLLEMVDHNVSMIDAFAMIDGLLLQAVKGIADMISKPGHINVDFADVKTIMKGMGLAVMGTGRAAGQDRAEQAARQAISSPLLETMNIHGARGVLINISGGTSLGLHEIGAAAQVITEHADEDANIIVGSVIDPSLDQEVMITVIATGFAQDAKNASQHVIRTAPAPHVAHQPIPVPQPTPLPSIKAAALDNDLLTIVEPQQPQPEIVLTDLESAPATDYTQAVALHDLDVPTFLRKPTNQESSQ
jgi:cell division protein FtsZ